VVALQGEVTNHPKVRRSRAVRVECCGERRVFECVRCDPMKVNESERQVWCRNVRDDIKTGPGSLVWDEPAGCLFIDRVVSGVYAARAWVRLLYGTWEPVVSWGDRLVVSDMRLVVPGKVPSGGNRKELCIDAGRRGGPSGSSVEGPVMGLERSGQAIQARLTVNHECGRSR
jgi:hypothetical protein